MFEERCENNHETITVVSLLFINLVIHCRCLALHIYVFSTLGWRWRWRRIFRVLFIKVVIIPTVLVIVLTIYDLPFFEFRNIPATPPLPLQKNGIAADLFWGVYIDKYEGEEHMEGTYFIEYIITILYISFYLNPCSYPRHNYFCLH